MTVPKEEATANYVPAAAVIRRWQALSGFTGRKGSVGGYLSGMRNTPAYPECCIPIWISRVQERKVEFLV